MMSSGERAVNVPLELLVVQWRVQLCTGSDDAHSPMRINVPEFDPLPFSSGQSPDRGGCSRRVDLS